MKLTLKEIQDQIQYHEAEIAKLRDEGARLEKFPEDFKVKAVLSVLKSSYKGEEFDVDDFDEMFSWESTPQGHDFWVDLFNGNRIEPTDYETLCYLQKLVIQHTFNLKD